jgi:hypothetical protein
MGVADDIDRTPGEARQLIADYRGMIQAYRSLIRVTETNMTNDAYFERTCDDHQRRIEWHQAQLAQLRHSREHGAEIIEDAKNKIADFGKKIRILSRREEIQRLLKMQERLAEMEAAESAVPADVPPQEIPAGDTSDEDQDQIDPDDPDTPTAEELERDARDERDTMRVDAEDQVALEHLIDALDDAGEGE